MEALYNPPCISGTWGSVAVHGTEAGKLNAGAVRKLVLGLDHVRCTAG